MWNFHGRFLFGRDGYPVARFELLEEPELIADKIEEELRKNEPEDYSEDLLELVGPDEEEEDMVGEPGSLDEPGPRRIENGEIESLEEPELSASGDRELEDLENAKLSADEE